MRTLSRLTLQILTMSGYTIDWCRSSRALEAALNSIKQRAELKASGTVILDTDTNVDSFGLGLVLRMELEELGYQITKIPTPRT